MARSAGFFSPYSCFTYLLDSPYAETLGVPVRTKSIISSFDSLLRPRVSMVLSLCGVPPIRISRLIA